MVWSLNFDNVNLTADGDGDDSRSFGGSPRGFEGWTVSMVDHYGNHVPDTGSTPSYVDVTQNSVDTILANDGADKALLLTGWLGIAAEARFKATTNEEFWLQSFHLENLGMGADIRVLGFRDGELVASQNFTVAIGADTLMMLNQAADPDWQNIDEFRIVQQSGGADLWFAIDDVSVSAAVVPNVAPVVGNLNGDGVSFLEEGGAVLLDAGSNATLVDSDSADFNGGNITVAIITNRVASEDVLSVRNEGNGAGQVGLSGSAVLYGGVQVGTLAGGTGSTNMVISLNALATPEAVQAILRNLTYNNTNTADPLTVNRGIQISVNDGDGGTSNLSVVTVSVIGVNDAPTVSATGGTPTYTENGSAVDLFNGVSISAIESGQTITGMTLTVTNLADGASEILTIDGVDVTLTNGFSTITSTNAMTVTVSVVGGTATVTVSKAGGIGTADAQTLVDGISYRNTSDTPTTADSRVVTLTSITDNGGTANGGVDAASLSIEATVTVVAADDPSTVSTSGGTTAFTEGNSVASTPVAIDPGLTLSDPDSASLVSATVSITGNFQSAQDVLAFVNNGSTMGNITGSYNAGTGVLTLTSAGGLATLAQWQAALRSVTYSNSSDLPNTSARTISFVVNDGASDSNAATKAVSVTSVNDAPVIIAPASRIVTEDIASPLTGISFSDADAGAGSVTATFSVGSGTLSGASGGGVTVSGSGTGTLTLTGMIANINAFIAASNLTFTTAANATSNVTLTIGISDGGNTGGGGAQTDSETVTLQVAAVNDAPVITAPASIYVNEDVVTALTGITVSDVDAGNGEIEARVSVGSGTLILNGEDVGQSLTLAGRTLQDLNDLLASGSLAFRTDANSTGNVVLTIQVEDYGNTGSGGSRTDITTVTLVVTAVNDAPVNNVPIAQSVDQDSMLIFSAGNGNWISVSDVDAGSGNVQVTLTASNGLLTLGSTFGLSFITGSGTGDSTMTFQGSLADINLALNGMVFSPVSGYNGPASLQIITNDLGLSGSGGSQIDSDTITIDVRGLEPRVTSVNATSPDGTYKVGDTLVLIVAFDRAVVVNTSGGRPSLLLDVGTVDRTAVYSSGSGTNTLAFIYTVQPGDVSADLDYSSTGALLLNGATIRDASNQDARLTLPAPGSASSIAGQRDIVIKPPDPGFQVISNPDGSVTIILTDPSQLTAALGTAQIDRVVYGGSGTVILPDTIENLTLTGGNANGYGNALRNLLIGSAGKNVLQGFGGNDTVSGHAGDDRLQGGSGKDRLDGGSGNDSLKGDGGNDTMIGGTGHDSLWGGTGADRLEGGTGNDTLKGDSGNDRIVGGQGRDKMWGGSGADMFVFTTVQESRVGSQRDVIYDFQSGRDVIDLRGIDANELRKGNQAFSWIGTKGPFLHPDEAASVFLTAGFTGRAGELRYDRGILMGDTDGDGRADFEIKIVGRFSHGDVIL